MKAVVIAVVLEQTSLCLIFLGFPKYISQNLKK